MKSKLSKLYVALFLLLGFAYASCGDFPFGGFGDVDPDLTDSIYDDPTDSIWIDDDSTEIDFPGDSIDIEWPEDSTEWPEDSTFWPEDSIFWPEDSIFWPEDSVFEDSIP
ncbi:MAG TPA: hypothetical protein PLJ00_17065 [Chitinophagales bacterium]|nr:hypothetical protein [Chitinophagales bacterium]HRG29614.1 hypothetical protein [Chitinophagales bacterium]HRG86627.1 hypothetical protein [Chitinophagales bacterium]HRH53881.1 hypothetical protein [Chitinophagales bacterium]